MEAAPAGPGRSWAPETAENAPIHIKEYTWKRPRAGPGRSWAPETADNGPIHIKEYT